MFKHCYSDIRFVIINTRKGTMIYIVTRIVHDRMLKLVDTLQVAFYVIVIDTLTDSLL